MTDRPNPDTPTPRTRASRVDASRRHLRDPTALKTARETRDPRMSQAALATAAGCTPGMISHLEAGRLRACTTALAGAIEEALGVTPGSVFDPLPGSDAWIHAGQPGQP